MTIIESAPAKINLGLRILGKRPDGYHDILSVFQTVSLYDELTLDPAEEPSIDCSYAGVPSGPANLALKAEACYHDLFRTQSRARFTLVKRIPVGAGLGGGSSDAAAALRGLTRLNAETNHAGLYDCACRLGSDIPFLLKGGTAVVAGRGESISHVHWPFDFTYVIVYPGFGVSTKWAYGSLRGFADDCGVYKRMTEKLGAGILSKGECIDALVNDFEPTVMAEYPRIGEIKRELMSCGALHALMSGSGSSVIGMFDSGETAQACARHMITHFEDVFVVKAV